MLEPFEEFCSQNEWNGQSHHPQKFAHIGGSFDFYYVLQSIEMRFVLLIACQVNCIDCNVTARPTDAMWKLCCGRAEIYDSIYTIRMSKVVVLQKSTVIFTGAHIAHEIVSAPISLFETQFDVEFYAFVLTLYLFCCCVA